MNATRDRNSNGEPPSGTVTFLLTDVSGSTRLWDRNPAATTRAMARHHEIIDEAVGKHSGIRPVEQGEGDSTVSAFTSAADAIAAAIDIQLGLSDEAWPEITQIAIRIGIHTGEAQLSEEGTYVGAALSRCARIRSLGHGGQTLLSRTTADLVRDDLPPQVSLKDLGEHPLRGLSRDEQVFQLHAPGLPTDFPPLVSPRSRSPLPEQVTRFIGREQEIEEVTDLLEETRLLTLVGAGGCGKTRLAIEVAGRITDRFGDGIIWVDLASLSDPQLVASTVATTLNIREALIHDPTDTVAAHLEQRNALILLDNCEHLAGACAAFADRILRACGAVIILATSREPFGVSAETSWRVPSLTLPSTGGDDAEQSESVRLFIDRARKARPRLEITPEALGAITSICHRVDGIPLAIELAAARVRTMSPHEIAKGIAERFSLLAGGSRTALARQRTLEASVDWSYALLGEPERVLFRRLAIFAGGFTLEAAERVCAGGALGEFAVLEVLSHLVDRSLVQMDEVDDDIRYRFLETVRVYARQKLADSEDASLIRDRHMAFFVEFVERAEIDLATAAMISSVRSLERDLDNIRAAIEWGIDSQQTDPALRLCSASGLFWLYGNHLVEGRRRVDSMVALEGGDPSLRARALAAAAAVAGFSFDDPDVVRTLAEQALTIAQELDDDFTIGRAWAMLGFATLLRDTAAGRDHFERGLVAAERSGDPTSVAVALPGSAMGQTLLSDPDRASETARRALQWARGTKHPDFEAQTLNINGFRAMCWGEFDSARRFLDESIAIARTNDLHFPLAMGFGFRGAVETSQGRFEDARRDLEESIEIARPEGLLLIVGMSGAFLAEAFYAAGLLDDAAALMEESLAIARAGGFQIGIIWGLTLDALMKEAQGDLVPALGSAEEALSLARAEGYRRWDSRALLAASRIQYRQGSLEEADKTVREALAVAVGSQLPLEIVEALEQIAAIASGHESYEESARLFGTVESARRAMSYPRYPIMHEEDQNRLLALREALGADRFEVFWSEGSALSLEEAVSYATRAHGERKRPSHGWASLTPTELDVVRRVQTGLTNPQIAEQLFISKYTVQTHLSHIFAKLNMKTRAEVAAEATRRGL